MSIKDVLALALRLEADEPTLRAASMVAGRFSAHATALVLTVHAASVYAPLSQVLEDLADGERCAAAEERRRIERWLAQAPHAMENRRSPVRAQRPLSATMRRIARRIADDRIGPAQPFTPIPARHRATGSSQYVPLSVPSMTVRQT